MRKLHRYIPALTTAGMTASVLTTIVCFMVGIWTPSWHQIHNSDGFYGCDGKDACYQYQGDGRWFLTALLFLVISLALGAYRAWQYYEDEDHGH